MIWKIYRYRRWGNNLINNIFKRILPVALFLMMLFIGFELGSRTMPVYLTLPVSNLAVTAPVNQVYNLVGVAGDDFKKILGAVLPVASYGSQDYIEDEATDLWGTAMRGVTTVDLREPRSFFDSQLALFNAVKPVSAEPEFMPEIVTDKTKVPEKISPDSEQIDLVVPKSKKDKPLVGIYCTHNAESYAASQGVDRLEGKNGGVFSVAEHLKDTLKNKYGIGVVLSETIHDYPDWKKSYANSLVTLEQMKKDYPSIKVFIDVHRDALPSRKNAVVTINQKQVARIMFIAGSDTRLPHPNWRDNWHYVKNIADVMEEKYPGLSKGVRVQDGRYNQHASPHAILTEIGATTNTLAEAKGAAEMLADVLNSIL